MRRTLTSITVELMISSTMDSKAIRKELFTRHGCLSYVWNNCATLYGPSGVTIEEIREVELP